ncbi:MAG: ferrous iron transport protein A [Pseudomonadaceae bacterium]|nr:ferrous iron transport protein A [Pseudomonadaceae bacterium]
MTSSLADLDTGTVIRITGFAEDSAYNAQLKRLGMVPGTVATFLRCAPLGDPIELRLRGYSLALRPSEAISLQFEIVS